MTNIAPKKLGRYTLLDRIAEGGSAEVFRGLEDRGHGIQRLVAIKVVHWELAGETAFLKLFREETKVSLGLNHPNIVQTFDFGEDEDGRPYIVFEYVHGQTLRALLDRLDVRETLPPVELSVFIAEQAARALHYAHAFEEPLTGRVLNIVHRDLSPHNLMISYDGIPKLIDFGIAKVLQEKDRTQTGLIKGKPAYLSPEQVAGQPLDGRSDLFALGIVLWESLTGKKLFGGGSAFSIMERISSKDFKLEPPSDHNKQVSQELDQIVMKALARDRALRHQTASELQGELYKLISQKNRDTYFAELAGLLANLFEKEIASEKAAIRNLPKSEPVSDPVSEARPSKPEKPKKPVTVTILDRPVSHASFRRNALQGVAIGLIVLGVLWVALRTHSSKTQAPDAAASPVAQASALPPAAPSPVPRKPVNRKAPRPARVR